MLWLLAVSLPLLSWFLWWAWRKRQQLIGQFVQSRLLAQLTVGVSVRRQKLRLLLVVLAVGLVFVALARPQYGFRWEEVKQRGLDIVVAIDTSRSMLAADVAPNRLTRAKLAALDLLRVARHDRLGLVSFAGTAFLQCPLTLDDAAFRQSVGALEVGIIPQGGTALAEAIETALSAFKDGQPNEKALLLLSDGEDHEGGAVEAAEKAAKAGLRIFTIGIGTPEGDRLRLTDERGQTGYVQDESGQTVTSRLNEETLRKIAKAAKGEYVPLRGANQIELLYRTRLGLLAKSDLATRLAQQYYEQFQWPLGLAILLLALETFLPDRRRVVRSEQIAAAANPALRKVVTALALLALPLTANASAGRALRDYEAGKFQAAEREYQRLLQKRPDDARLQYNAGTAAYRAGRLEGATNALDAALLSSDPELLKRVYYNLGNAHYRLGEREADLNAKVANWEESLRDYESALRLNPADADAKFNRDLVAKKLEELKRQQAKSQPKPGDQNKDQQKEDQNQQKRDKEQPEQAQNAAPRQQPPEEPKPEGKQEQQQAQRDQSQPPQPPPPQPAKSDQPEAKPQGAQAQPPSPADQDQGKQEEASEAKAARLGQMTPEQARQLLEAAKAEEKPMIFILPPDAKRRARSLKDW
jgi:Ca-activated chloride channel family protein